MKKLVKTFLKIISVTIIPISIFASGWPEFNVLTSEAIKNLFVTDGCSNNEVKIPEGTKIQIQNRYIPSDEKWYWIYHGPHICTKMPTGIGYTAYEQTGNRDLGGDIITHYQVISPQAYAFKFIFHYQPGWDCGSLFGPIPPEMVGCAQDMLNMK